MKTASISTLGNEYVEPFFLLAEEETERYFLTRDDIHTVGPLFPMDQFQLYAANYGMTWGESYSSYPPNKGASWRIANGFPYVISQDVTDPEEMKQREAKWKKHTAELFPKWKEHWGAAEREYEAMIGWLENTDFEKDPDMSDPPQRLKLLEYHDRMFRDLMRGWELHFAFEPTALLRYGEFKTLCDELFPGIEEIVVTDFLTGFGTRLMETDAAFWRLGELAIKLGVADIIKTAPLNEVVPRLRKVNAAKKWIEELKGVLKVYGNRNLGGVMNLAIPTWREEYYFPIFFIRNYIPRIERGRSWYRRRSLRPGESELHRSIWRS